MKVAHILTMSGFSMLLSMSAVAQQAESPYLNIQWNSQTVRNLLSVRTGLCQADVNPEAAPVKSKYNNGDEWPRTLKPSVLRAMFYLAYDYYGMGLNHYFTLRQDMLPDFTKRFATAKPVEYKVAQGNEVQKLVTPDYTRYITSNYAKASAGDLEVPAKAGENATSIYYRHAVIDPFDLEIVADQVHDYRVVGLSAAGKRTNPMHFEASADYIQNYYAFGTGRDNGGVSQTLGVLRTASFLYPGTGEEGKPDYQLYSYRTKQQLEPVRAPYLIDGHESFGEGRVRLDPQAAQYALCAQWRMQQERERSGQATETDRLLNTLMQSAGFTDENDGLWIISAGGY